MQWIARVNRAYITIVLLGIFTFASTFAYLQSLDKKIAVAQLSKNVSSGEIISNADLSYVSVSSDEIIKKNMIDRSDIEKGRLVARIDLSANDLLTKSNTVRRATNSGLQSLSIGIESDHANGGDISKNDLIDIWRTGEDAKLIASSIEVRNVIEPNKRLGIASSKSITLVLAVTPSQAQSLSSVIGTTDLMIVVSTGSTTKDAINLNNKVISEPPDGDYEPFIDPSPTNEGD